MAEIASYEDVKSGRKERQVPTGTAWRTNFITPEEDNPDSPQAFLVEGTPGRVIKPHFHEHDQYQVVVYGGGVLGKRTLVPNAVHFSRSHTPYGPIVFGEQSLAFLTLRAQKDAGAQYLDDPEKVAKLSKMENRRPWQATEAPRFSKVASGSALHAFTEIGDDQGLASYSLTLAPGARELAPDPSTTNGQYLIITSGSLLHEGKEYKALSVAFVRPNEAPLELVAGSEGLAALVLHFPRAGDQQSKTVADPKAAVPGKRVWQCMLCAFVYDEAKGLPDEGIAPGTPWEDIPEDWICPDCATSKSEFQMTVVG